MTLAGNTTATAKAKATTGGDVGTLLATTSAEKTGAPNNNSDHLSTSTVARSSSSSTSSRCLILQLQGDFRAEGKTSCRDCLRTKTLPCSRVVEVADGAIFSKHKNEHKNEDEKKDAATEHYASSSSSLLQGSPVSPSQILRNAYEILLDEYTNFLPPYPSNSNSNTTASTITIATTATTATATNTIRDEAATQPSSLQCMNRVSVILRFIQLLLLLSKREQQRQQSASSFPSAAEVNKMMVSLLDGWTRGICEFTRFCETNDNNAAAVDMDEVGNHERNNENEKSSCCLTIATLASYWCSSLFI